MAKQSLMKLREEMRAVARGDRDQSALRLPVNVEAFHRGIRFIVGPDRRGERMWTIYPEVNVVITGVVARDGLEDILRRTIGVAQEAIDEWLDLGAEPQA